MNKKVEVEKAVFICPKCNEKFSQTEPLTVSDCSEGVAAAMDVNIADRKDSLSHDRERLILFGFETPFKRRTIKMAAGPGDADVITRGGG